MLPRPQATSRQSARKFSFKDNGPRDGFKFRGNHFCDDSLVTPKSLVWKNDKGRCTVAIRIVPQPVGDTDWSPYRFSDEPTDFGDFICAYPAWRKTGQGGATFLLEDTAIPDHEQDTTPNPVRLFMYNINAAIKAGTDPGGWAGLLTGGAGQSAEIPAPTTLYFVMGPIYEMGLDGVLANPEGLGPRDKMPLLMLGNSAGQMLVRRMTEVYGSAETDIDVSRGLAHEGDFKLQTDPVAINKGMFWKFFPFGNDPRSTGREAPRAAGEREPIGYDCFATPSVKPYMSASLAGQEDLVRSRMHPWENILIFPTLEEQAELFVQRIKDPAMIRYAWADEPQYMKIANDYYARRVVSAPSGEQAAPSEEDNNRPLVGPRRAAVAPSAAHPKETDDSAGSLPSRSPLLPPQEPTRAGNPPFVPGSRVNTADPDAVAAAAARVAPTATPLGVNPDKVNESEQKLASARARMAQRNAANSA
jgi:hypothetical protein